MIQLSYAGNKSDLFTSLSGYLWSLLLIISILFFISLETHFMFVSSESHKSCLGLPLLQEDHSTESIWGAKVSNQP